MNRRESLRALGIGAISTTVLLEACKQPETAKEIPLKANDEPTAGKEAWEVNRDKKLNDEQFFNKEEMATITILADLIIPKDGISGSASDAKVPDFIEFIVKDMPEHQVPMRGGLKWIDLQSYSRFQKAFADAGTANQKAILDDIAYPSTAKPEMHAGVAFFKRMRNLTASGFYTTEMGVKDIGYVGNRPNQWTGVPLDVMKQYGVENVKV